MKHTQQERPVTLGSVLKLDSQDFMRKNSGQILQKYIKSLQENFSHYQAINFRKDKQMQRIIYSSLLMKFNEMYNSHATNQEEIIYKLTKYHQQVLENKQFKKYSLYLEHIINSTMKKGISQINYLNNDHDNYLCQLIKAICKQKSTTGIVGIFTSIFSSSESQYGKQQLQKLKQALGYAIVIFDFDQDKNMQQFQVNFQHIYILKAKHHYYYLIPKNSPRSLQQIVNETPSNLSSSGIKPINMVRQTQLSANQLERIFLKEGGSPKKQLPKQQKKDIFFPHKIECSVCQSKQSEFDCLHWNYAYYCQTCVIDPLINTNNIPANLLLKYLKERDLFIKEYPIQCPECKSTHVFRNYDPTKKPSFFVCQACRKTICTQHLGMVQSCFCYCKACKTSTMNIPRLNIKICQLCNKKKCSKCGSQSKKLCSCICKNCLQDDTQINHLCEKKCHSCWNAFPNLKTCYCGMPICYGCYYKFLILAKNGNYKCSFIDFQ